MGIRCSRLHARFDFSPDLPVNYLLIVIAAEDIYIMEQLSTSTSVGTVTVIIAIPLAVAPARCRCAPAPNIARLPSRIRILIFY